MVMPPPYLCFHRRGLLSVQLCSHVALPIRCWPTWLGIDSPTSDQRPATSERPAKDQRKTSERPAKDQQLASGDALDTGNSHRRTHRLHRFVLLRDRLTDGAQGDCRQTTSSIQVERAPPGPRPADGSARALLAALPSTVCRLPSAVKKSIRYQFFDKCFTPLHRCP